MPIRHSGPYFDIFTSNLRGAVDHGILKTITCRQAETRYSQPPTGPLRNLHPISQRFRGSERRFQKPWTSANHSRVVNPFPSNVVTNLRNRQQQETYKWVKQHGWNIYGPKGLRSLMYRNFGNDFYRRLKREDERWIFNKGKNVTFTSVAIEATKITYERKRSRNRPINSISLNHPIRDQVRIGKTAFAVRFTSVRPYHALIERRTRSYPESLSKPGFKLALNTALSASVKTNRSRLSIIAIVRDPTTEKRAPNSNSPAALRLIDPRKGRRSCFHKQS